MPRTIECANVSEVLKVLSDPTLPKDTYIIILKDPIRICEEIPKVHPKTSLDWLLTGDL